MEENKEDSKKFDISWVWTALAALIIVLSLKSMFDSEIKQRLSLEVKLRTEINAQTEQILSLEQKISVLSSATLQIAGTVEELRIESEGDESEFNDLFEDVTSVLESVEQP